MNSEGWFQVIANNIGPVPIKVYQCVKYISIKVTVSHLLHLLFQSYSNHPSSNKVNYSSSCCLHNLLHIYIRDCLSFAAVDLLYFLFVCSILSYYQFLELLSQDFILVYKRSI